jgi:hypothetical protein
MSVHGAYPSEGQDEQYPVIKYGHPKDRRADLKRVRAGLAVSADGGIPVHARAFGGGPGSLAHRAEMAAHLVEPPAGADTAPGSAEGLPGRLHDRRRVPAPRAAARAGTRRCAMAVASSRSAPPSTGR